MAWKSRALLISELSDITPILGKVYISIYHTILGVVLMNKEEGKKEITRLVEQYRENRKYYFENGEQPVKEIRIKNDYLNKFFIALGWDVYNNEGKPEPVRDVIIEYALKVGSNTKAPDYAFTLRGNPIFFVEAKQPIEKIEESAKSAFQLRRYGWNLDMPLSILTNFETFIIYDCRIKPNEKDNPAVARRGQVIRYEQYVEKFDEIWNIFSREGVVNGSFDKYAESERDKKGSSQITDEFLKEIEDWRERLAKNIAVRNSELNIEGINYAVQKTIDRILFLIICEYKNIEKYCCVA